MFFLYKLEDSRDSSGLQQPVLVFQPLRKTVFGEVLAAKKGILGGSPVVSLNSF